MADVIRFTCSQCGQKYRAPARLAGRARTCVKCGAHFHIAADGTSSNAADQHTESTVAAAASSDSTSASISPAASVPVAAVQERPVAVRPAAVPVAQPLMPSPSSAPRPVAPAVMQPAAVAPEIVPPVTVMPVIAAVAESPMPIVEAAPARLPVIEPVPVRETIAEPQPSRQPIVEVVQVVQQFVEMAPAMRQAAPTPPAAIPEPTPAPELPAAEKKQCPFCGEDILKMAVKCKHCGEFLDGNGSKIGELQTESHARNNGALAAALAKAELSAADIRVRADRAGADARAKADEVAAVARRNEERRAAIHRQIEMQAESDYRQVLLRAADGLAAAEKSAVSMCRFHSDVYHAVERMGLDAVAAMEQAEQQARSGEVSTKDTLGVMSQVMDLVANPPIRFYRAHEKIMEAFEAYSQLDAMSHTPPTNMVTREATLADLHTRFAASMTDMRALIRTSEYPGA
jgi:hypothetical protein